MARAKPFAAAPSSRCDTERNVVRCRARETSCPRSTRGEPRRRLQYL